MKALLFLAVLCAGACAADAPAPTPTTSDDRLGATERQLSERYGRSQAHAVPVAPATRAETFRTETLNIDAHFVGDTAELLVITRRVGGITEADAVAILAQCGGGWKPGRDPATPAKGPAAEYAAMGWVRKDRAFAQITRPDTRQAALCVRSAKFGGTAAATPSSSVRPQTSAPIKF